MNFTKRLIDLRESKNMKQKDLADILNLKQSAVSKYENGLSQPPIPTLIRIAEYFEVSVDYLLGLSSIANPYTQEKFSPKEVEIVTKYRRLTPENQIRIDERMGAMIDVQKPHA